MSDDAIPDQLVITLRKPIMIGTLEYAELKLQEPTAAQWAEWSGLDGVAADIKAVATIAAVPETVIKQIGARDLLIASRYIARFLK